MKTIHPKRIQPLQATARNPRGRHVIYWMQQSQRVPFNHALEFAVQAANDRNQPLLVVFSLIETYPEANWRHFAFMLEGLRNVQKDLTARGIAFQILIGDPVDSVLKAAQNASVLVCDRGYLRHQRQWRHAIAQSAPCPVIQVESDVLVPVEEASTKAEYAARTIRKKIQRLLAEYMLALRPLKLKQSDPALADPVDIVSIGARLRIDRSVGSVSAFISGGHDNAVKRLKKFIAHQLPDYDLCRNEPHLDGSTMMSPFLHFGHISPLEMALAVLKSHGPQAAKEALLEELVVRRELAVNYAFYCPDYDRYRGLPRWARLTLAEHEQDPRDTVYTAEQLEAPDTHDPYWNAAMLEMKLTGYMHPYMRMYWGKKILQWSAKPKDAYALTLKLNNKYFIDGRDPNSYAGVGWIYGLHDQAWKERAIFGKVRYMARSGLERKFDMQGYIDKIKSRIADLPGASKGPRKINSHF